MAPLWKALILAALLLVAAVLAFGLFNMARGGSLSTSQNLMRWRVALHLIAIFITMTAIYFASRCAFVSIIPHPDRKRLCSRITI